MDIKEFISDFAQKTKEIIANLEKREELKGAEKKKQLDENMKKWAEELLNAAKMNILLKNAVKQFIIANIPVITQAVYDLIKARIKGITEAV